MSSTPLPPALRVLVRERNVAADAALAEVLPLLEERVQREVWDILVRRGHEPALAGIVAKFGSFAPTLQSRIVARAESLLGPVRLAFEDSDMASLAGAIAIIVHSGYGPLIYLLADAIRSPVERRRRLAGVGLCRVCERLTSRTESGRPTAEKKPDDSVVDHVGEALSRAVHLWGNHRQRKVMECALWFSARTMPAIRKKLDDPHSPISGVLMDLLSSAADPRLAEFVVRALAVPKLQAAAASAIAEATRPKFVRALLDHTWLLSDRDIEKGCRRIQRIKWIDDQPELLGDVGDRDAANVVRLIEASGGSLLNKIERLGELLRLEKPSLTQAVLLHLIGDRSQESTDMLGKIAGRFTGKCERLCREELRSRRTGSSASETGKVEVSSDRPDGGVQSLFSAFWDRFESPGSDELTPLRGQLLLHKAALPALLRARLAFGDPAERRRVLRMVPDLGVTQELAETVFRSAHDTDPSVRGCAISILGSIPGPTSVRILRQAVNDPDERVQATAIEVLDRLDWSERVPVTRPKLRSPHNRVRANAIKSLLRMEIPEAGEALLDMLEDSSGRHRLSAIWVVERAGLKSLSTRMALLSRDDPDERVRRRAASVIQSLGVRCGHADISASL